MVLANAALGQTAQVSSASLSSISSTLSTWQSINSQSQMTEFSSATANSIFALYERSQTELNYYLMYTQHFVIGQIPSGSINSDCGCTLPTNVSNVGVIAQGVLNLTVTISSAIEQYCQQYALTADQVNSNCVCPTVEQCQAVSFIQF